MYRLFSDQVAMLAAQCPEGTGAKAAQLQKLAIATTYRNLPLQHPWSYYRRRSQVVTNAPYGTGSIAYSASTRAVTLSGGTWPSWSANGSVVLNGKVYKVLTRDSDSQVTLVSDRSPVVDIAAGSAFQLYQSEYTLPADFSKMENVVEIGSAWVLEYIPPEQILDWDYTLYNPTRPWRYSMRGAQYGPPGRMAIEFIPPPASAQTFDLLYEAKPRARTLAAEYKTGTISISGTAVTGTGTAFTVAMAGCVLRVGSAENIPTDGWGAYPYTGEYVVSSVTDGTHLTLTSSATTVTDVQYLIDDYIDVDLNMMLSTFEMFCQAEYMQSSNIKNFMQFRQAAVQSLLAAKGADYLSSLHDVTPMRPLDLYGTAVAPNFAPMS